jgi:hypothetical protein
VDKVGLGQAFLRVIRFLPVNIIPPWLSMLVHHLEDKQDDLRWLQFMNLENQGGMISTGELLIRPPELSGNPKSSRLVASQEEFGEGNDEFSLPVSLFMLPEQFLHAVKFYDMGKTALLPLRRKRCCGILLPLKNQLPLPGVNPRT